MASFTVGSILGIHQCQEARFVKFLLSRLQSKDAKVLVRPFNAIRAGVPVPHPHPRGLLRQPELLFAISQRLLHAPAPIDLEDQISIDLLQFRGALLDPQFQLRFGQLQLLFHTDAFRDFDPQRRGTRQRDRVRNQFH